MFQITLIRARRQLERAEDAFARGDQGAAMGAFEVAFKQATRRAPAADSAETGVAAAAQIGLGRLRLRSGEYDLAQPHFEQALTLCPSDPAGLYWAGCAAAHSGQHRFADTYFTHVLARNPSEPRALAQRAYVRLLQGDPAAARADLRTAADSELSPEARPVLALLQLQAGQWTAAKELLAGSEAADSVGGLGFRHRLLALALEGTGESADALEAYNRALALDGDHAPDGALYRHGALAYHLGRFDECTRVWRTLHQRHPEDPRTRSLVTHALHADAWDCLRRKDFAGAVQRLADRDMHGGQFDDARVELHLYAAAKECAGSVQGDGTQRAREHLQSACELRPTDVRVLHHLGLLEFLDGHRRQAEALWQRVLRTHPDELRTRYALVLARIASQAGTAAATAELAALVDAAYRSGDAELTGRMAASLAAVRIRAGDWAGAGDALLPHPGGPGRDTLLGEALYRAGNPQGAPPAAFGPWQSIAAGSDHHNSDEDPRVRRERALRARKEQLGAALLAVDESSGAAGEFKAPDWSLVVDPSLTEGSLAGGLETAVLLHLGGHTEQAREVFLRTWRADPSDPRTARTIGLALIGTLLDGGRPEAEADTAWRLCLAAWGAVLENREAWAEFLEDAELRYGEPVSEPERIKVAQALKSYVAGRLPEASRQGSPLPTLFQREALAAESLFLTGGFPVRGRLFACGPLALAELGVSSAFGAHVAAVERRLVPEEFQELLSHFSALGLAAVQSESGAYAAALNTLADLRCPACRGRKGVGGKGADGSSSPSLSSAISAWAARDRPLLCERSCRGFDELHPGYAGLRDRQRRLAADTMAQAGGILLKVGTEALREQPPELGVARAAWQGALHLADSAAARRKTGEKVVKVALGRADALQRGKNNEDGVVAVLDLAVNVLGGDALADRARGRLASALNQRGVRKANVLLADKELLPHTVRDRMDRPVADVRRAAELNPHSALIRQNLGELLNAQVGIASRCQDISDLLQRQTAALEYAEKLRRDFPHHKGVADLHRAVSKNNQTLVEALRLGGRPTYIRRR